jgi:hypothetical protein
MVSSVVVGIPLVAVGLLTGATPIQLPPGLHPDATAFLVAALLVVLLMPILMFVGWIAWVPFTLIGAWIAGEPAAPFSEPHDHSNVPDEAAPALTMIHLLDSAIGVGSSHRVLTLRDENHPMAVRVNGRDFFYTALGTLPSAMVRHVAIAPGRRAARSARLRLLLLDNGPGWAWSSRRSLSTAWTRRVSTPQIVGHGLAQAWSIPAV